MIQQSTPGHISRQKFHWKRYMHLCVHCSTIFTIAKTWKQPKCPSIDEWIKKMWYIYRLEYYLALKNNKIMPFAATWMVTRDSHTDWSKSEREKQIPYDITYLESNIGHKWTFPQKRKSWTWGTESGCHRGGGGSGMDWEFGVNRCKLLPLQWISNEILLYSAGNDI